MLEQTPRLRPCMVVAIDEKGGVVGQILAQIRVKRRFLYINFTRRARIYGEGCYKDYIDYIERKTFRYHDECPCCPFVTPSVLPYRA